MHFWSKFGKPHFIWFWLIARTNSQAQNGVNLDFQVQFDLEDHRQSPHKTIGILIKVFYISDQNLVILAWTVDELSHGQAHDWRTHRHTHIHTHTQATTIPEGQNWPRVKMRLMNYLNVCSPIHEYFESTRCLGHCKCRHTWLKICLREHYICGRVIYWYKQLWANQNTTTHDSK